MSSYLVYICQAVNDRAGLERYWQEAPAVYPKNIDVLVAYVHPRCSTRTRMSAWRAL